MIELTGATVTFNTGTALETRALRGLNLTVPDGQFVTIIGSNGAGKSTLLNCIAGEQALQDGRLSIDATDITDWPVWRRARQISRLFQDPRAGLCERMTIEENIAIAAARTHPRGFGFALTAALRREARDRLAELGLGLEQRLGDRADLLSGGQRQALCLVMATLGDTKVLLLDEHTAALDPATAQTTMQLTARIVARLGITTVMVTHSMRQALDYGDRIIMLHQGHIVLDVAGADRRALSVDDLLRRFRRKEGLELADDQLLLG
jgi:putative ABC transport system ATP-binding protein